MQVFQSSVWAPPCARPQQWPARHGRRLAAAFLPRPITFLSRNQRARAVYDKPAANWNAGSTALDNFCKGKNNFMVDSSFQAIEPIRYGGPDAPSAWPSVL